MRRHTKFSKHNMTSQKYAHMGMTNNLGNKVFNKISAEQD